MKATLMCGNSVWFRRCGPLTLLLQRCQARQRGPRKRRDEPLQDDVAAALEDPDDDPEIARQKQDKGALMRSCLARLSPEHREVIDLVYYHEKSVAEVAEITGAPQATVKTRMFYARKRLSELFAEAGVDRGWP